MILDQEFQENVLVATLCDGCASLAALVANRDKGSSFVLYFDMVCFSFFALTLKEYVNET